MPYDFNKHVQTGRTTRLLNKAINLARDHGRYVLVFGADKNHRHVLCADLSQYAGIESVGSDKFYIGEQGGSISVVSPSDNFDWTRMREPTAHRDVMQLVDPFTIQFHKGRLLNALLEGLDKYNEPAPSAQDTQPPAFTAGSVRHDSEVNEVSLSMEYMVRPPEK